MRAEAPEKKKIGQRNSSHLSDEEVMRVGPSKRAMSGIDMIHVGEIKVIYSVELGT